MDMQLQSHWPPGTGFEKTSGPRPPGSISTPISVGCCSLLQRFPDRKSPQSLSTLYLGRHFLLLEANWSTTEPDISFLPWIWFVRTTQCNFMGGHWGPFGISNPRDLHWRYCMGVVCTVVSEYIRGQLTVKHFPWSSNQTRGLLAWCVWQMTTQLTNLTLMTATLHSAPQGKGCWRGSRLSACRPDEGVVWRSQLPWSRRTNTLVVYRLILVILSTARHFYQARFLISGNIMM
jgi:hypothetical protein